MSEKILPDRRNTVRQKLVVGGNRVYLDVGLYEDGSPGEIFIVIEKTGAGKRWLFDEVARLASKLIQHGCPLEQVAEGWLNVKGSPHGPVRGHDQVKFASSILDAIAKVLLIEYCGRKDIAI